MFKREAATPLVGLPTKLGSVKPLGYPVLQIDAGALLFDLHIVLFRLSQSQTQTGTTSTIPADVNPQPDRLGLALQAAGDFLCRRSRDSDHNGTSVTFVAERMYTRYGIMISLSMRLVNRFMAKGKFTAHAEYQRLELEHITFGGI